jgi:HD-GYP domain-containing protein (c-di-GMP phosphodiesterase class II)
LISERSYKKAWSRQDAITEIEQQSGRQFDPQIVEAFLSLIRE